MSTGPLTKQEAQQGEDTYTTESEEVMIGVLTDTFTDVFNETLLMPPNEKLMCDCCMEKAVLQDIQDLARPLARLFMKLRMMTPVVDINHPA